MGAPDRAITRQHALHVVLQYGIEGRTWTEIAAFLNSHNLRTSTKKRWTGLNARVHFQKIATHELKVIRGRALERHRGIRSSYLEWFRKMVPDTGGAVI